MSGFPAWITWLVVHIFFLIGFRNRISVFAAWVWTYFTFTRGARLITGDQRLPGWQEATSGSAQDRENPVPDPMIAGEPVGAVAEAGLPA